MGQFLLLIPFLAASLSRAADNYGSPSPVYGAPPQATHQVQVGDNGELKYYPEYIDARVGDSVVFTFHPKNHTVTQASFNDPCTPLQNGFDSGFRPVPAGTTYGLPTFTVDVKDTSPIWVHCKQPGPPRHCTQGMVFAINAPKSGNTFDEFKKKALALNASSTSSTSAAPPQGTQTVHEVSVGANGMLKYDPEYINATVGDTVRFTFHQKAHSVTQAAFDTPCVPLGGGFDSGLLPVAANVTSNFPTYTIKVNDTKPIWAYCKQPGPPAHCPQGMVFAINAPPVGNTFDAFKKKALALNASSTSSTSAAPPQGTQTVHEVSVGANGMLKYDPEYINATVGDTVRFTFHQKAHSVTQAAFDTPCVPLGGGFDSGLLPVAANVTSNFPTYTIKVNDTKPIWAYCKQPGPPAHCPQGMVFAINAPPVGNTFDAFKKKALALNASSASSTYSAQPSSTYSGAYPSSSDTCAAAKPVETYPFHPYNPVTHHVTVGGDAGNVFTPNSIDAVPGDFVLFEFQKKNHTVTQSSFNDPCTKLETSTSGYEKGFDSGFNPVDAGTTKNPTFQIQVNDTKPIWGYCRQTGHCVSGMAFGINAPKYGPHTIEAFIQLAKHSNATSITPDYSSAKPAASGY